jgi:hypothetical protein
MGSSGSATREFSVGDETVGLGAIQLPE